MKYPEIAVIVKSFAGHKIYVGGEVNNPGMISDSGRMTTLQAIFFAGGFKNTAELKSVVLIRKQETGDPLFVTLNLEEDLTAHAQRNDVKLKPYDIIYVPKSRIAEMNQFVDQYIEKLIPISKNMGFNWVYEINQVKVD